jgi:hypothetical protein
MLEGVCLRYNVLYYDISEKFHLLNSCYRVFSVAFITAHISVLYANIDMDIVSYSFLLQSHTRVEIYFVLYRNCCSQM